MVCGTSTYILGIYLSIYLSIYLPVHLSMFLSICPSICLSIYLSISQFICLSIYGAVCLSSSLSVYLSFYLSFSMHPPWTNDAWTSRSGANMWCFEHIHNALHFFSVSTSKSARNPLCFSHVWFPNVLRAAAACTCSTSQRPKVLRNWGVFSILTSHHQLQFLSIVHLSSAQMAPRHFREPSFRPSGAPELWKNAVFRDFSTSSRTLIFFLPPFSSLTLPTFAFPSLHIVGSLTSKLPSITILW